ncbi:hypothetical protein L2E82_05967 [Cichorium intybus]|uniref:Uncharacterized protein n=1 Tax=Cichorium intybus TaxID=13427 RepID=A0ACB9H8Q3_CICIN|nr:hypothetical protein L2E82_05967 [Cichorium intybus]
MHQLLMLISQVITSLYLQVVCTKNRGHEHGEINQGDGVLLKFLKRNLPNQICKNSLCGTKLLDLPGSIEGAAKEGKGIGRQVISTARTCNCILIVSEFKPITYKCLIEKELEGFGIRLNKEPPNLTFRKREKVGINFTSTSIVF